MSADQPLAPPTEPVTTKALVSDAALLAHIGFTRQSEIDLIIAFAKERDLSVRALLAHSLRVYHTQQVIGPQHILVDPSDWPPRLQMPRPGDPDYVAYGCPDLGD